MFMASSPCMDGIPGCKAFVCRFGERCTLMSADGSFTEAQQELMHSAALDGMPRLRDLPSPRLLCLHNAGSTEEERLRWLYPDAEFLSEPAPDVRAAYAPEEMPGLVGIPFVCGPGMEACWPGPSPEFYRTSTCSAYLFQNNAPEALS